MAEKTSKKVNSKKTVENSKVKKDQAVADKAKLTKAKGVPRGNSQEAREAAPASSSQAETLTTAKAGKRSSKALKEAEQKEAKEERKAHAKEEKAEPKSKPVQKPPRSKLERRGKKYRQAAEQIEKDKDYALEDALNLAVKTSTVKFDATVELHLNLAVDPKIADQNVRGTVILPAGTGKSSRVAVVSEADDAKKAKAAGADIAGSEDVFNQLDKEKLDFDVLIATPAMMPKLGKYARLLGPKGLMPNPKSGTVTTDVAKAVKEAKAGRVEYRVDSTGILHAGIGKVSFGAEKLTQNARAILDNLKNNKPASVKGALITRAFATTTMGPSISITLSDM